MKIEHTTQHSLNAKLKFGSYEEVGDLIEAFLMYAKEEGWREGNGSFFDAWLGLDGDEPNTLTMNVSWPRAERTVEWEPFKD